MASNGNGFKPFTFVGSVIGGTLAAIVIIYNTVYAPLSCAIAKTDDTARADRMEIRKERTEMLKDINGKFDKIMDVLKVSAISQQDIKTSMTYMQCDINNIKADVEKIKGAR